MRYELSPDCSHPEPGNDRRLCEHCDAYVEPLTAFELPDFRKLVATGRYRADVVGRGRIELSPTQQGVDESPGRRPIVYRLTARTI